MYNKEIVICAAIWVQDGKKRPYQPTNIPSGKECFAYDYQAGYTSSSIVCFPKQFCLGGPDKENNGKSRE